MKEWTAYNIDKRIIREIEQLEILNSIIKDLIDCINLLGSNESNRFRFSEPFSRNMLNLKLSNELERKMHEYSDERKAILKTIRFLNEYKDNISE